MKAARWLTGLSLLMLLLSSVGGAAQGEAPLQESKKEVPIETMFQAMVDPLRMAMIHTTLAVASPTRIDQQLHVQQVVNLLEGAAGKHFVYEALDEEQKMLLMSLDPAVPGLIDVARAAALRLARAQLEPEMRKQVLLCAKSIDVFLNLALQEALLSLRHRNLEQATRDILKAYAYLSAALGRKDAPSPGGVLTFLYRLPYPSLKAAENQQP